ncbi:sensor histidine kinase [Hymenobacter chitinivorans]|uniref:Histidine kinase n=1 Tax=Hymenobacter chitinivorans DSM 11115 TaxID=1121954 RepID=A0A2M9BSL6_9BACT|nr:histidine kinase [Hymenobacter chitinivorans]PJJ60950.1 histidine kinase [Hymenobacter chitinivorans DSM 11115]
MIRKIALAALAAVAVFHVAVFIEFGTLWVGTLAGYKELLLVFAFLLPTFWAHAYIARLFGADRLTTLPATAKALLEGQCVVLVSVAFWLLFFTFPQHYLVPTAEITPKVLRLSLAISAVLSLFFYYFVEREHSRQHLQQEVVRVAQLQKETFQAQLEALKNQVDPHFLFNSLNVLGSLIHLDADRAGQFLGQLSDVYRALLDTGAQTLVPLRREMDLVRAYAHLMETRFGAALRVEWDVAPVWEQALVPPTAVQMLLENAIKHNGSTPRKPLIIKVSAADGMLVVENNRQPRTDAVASTHTGLQNIQRRYHHLTDRPVEIVPTPESFVVRLPLLTASAV